MPARKVTRRRTQEAPAPIQAWSPSRTKTWEICPAKLRFPMEGHQEPKSPPLLRGTEVHAEGEQYLNEQLDAVPTSYRYFEQELRGLRAVKAQPEVNLAFDKHWKRTDWLASDCWVRMRLDALVLKKSARVVDFKTGRAGRVSDEEQVDLYAVGVFCAWPKIRLVKGELWYVDSGDLFEMEYARKDMVQLREQWEARAAPMLKDRKLEAKPGPACKWCGFGKSKGGPCQEEQR